MTKIINLNNKQTKDYLLKSSSYINFDMPPYFNFGKMLQSLDKEISKHSISDFFVDDQQPKNCEEVNYKFLNNKSGPYDWRPFEIIHPALYVELVNIITEKKNWNIIVERFNFFNKNNKINCTSIPVISMDKEPDRAKQITSWWKDFEQQSIVMGLDYSYLFETDITNCYGSIYTHSIPWAIYGKNMAKEQKHDNKLFGNRLDKTIQYMTYGQTNGIPQGSLIMDLIAELVLGYVDYLLTERIKKIKNKYYKIIRYRDDYRIFVNSPQIGEEILKCLTETLYSLGLGLSDGKTKNSDDIVGSSIKNDKYFWLIHGKEYESIEKRLLSIKYLADRYPNSGSVVTSLDKLDQDIEKYTKDKKKIKGNIQVMISILISIMYKNPRAYPVATSVLSKILDEIKNKNNKKHIIKKIIKKFKRVPNVGHLEIWLQRMTLKIENEDYTERLCKKVNDNSIQIWNSDWLSENIKNIVQKTKIVDEKSLEHTDKIINNKEVSLFNY